MSYKVIKTILYTIQNYKKGFMRDGEGVQRRWESGAHDGAVVGYAEEPEPGTEARPERRASCAGGDRARRRRGPFGAFHAPRGRTDRDQHHVGLPLRAWQGRAHRPHAGHGDGQGGRTGRNGPGMAERAEAGGQAELGALPPASVDASGRGDESSSAGSQRRSQVRPRAPGDRRHRPHGGRDGLGAHASFGARGGYGAARGGGGGG